MTRSCRVLIMPHMRNNQRLSLFHMGLVVLLAWPGVAGAATYSVDKNHPQASDANLGTNESAPWATIGQAAQTMVAGDTVYVKSGIYYQINGSNRRYSPLLNPANSGSSGNPITFAVYPGDSVTITYDPGTTDKGPLIGAYLRNYIVWDGFIIQEVAANHKGDTGPVVIWRADYVTIQNCDIRGVEISVKDNHNGIRLERSI